MSDTAHITRFDIDWRTHEPLSRRAGDALRLLKDVRWVEELCPSEHAWHFVVKDQRAIALLEAAGLEIH